MRFPKSLIVFVALAMVVCFFLPYVSLTESYSSYLSRQTDEKIYNTGMSMSDVSNGISMFQYACIYIVARDEIYPYNPEIGIFYGSLISAILVFALLILLCGIKGRPILTFLINLLGAGCFYILNWDFEDRGILRGYGAKGWGIAHTVFPILFVIAVIGAIWLSYARKKAKRRLSHRSR